MVSSDDISQTSSRTLHDCLSLGEVQQGLRMTTGQDLVLEEIERLPMLLRLLSTMRNLVVPQSPILGDDENSKNNHSHEDNDTDPLVYQTVEQLEHVAAIHSVAEVVDVVTCYLAPTMTSRLSRVPPLKRRPDGSYDTMELQAVASNPIASTPRQKDRKRRKKEDPGAEGPPDENDGDSSVGLEDGSEGDDEEDTPPNENIASRKRKHNDVCRRTSMESALEDSQEATLIKTLSELITLVVASLDPIAPQNDDHPYDDQGKDAVNNNEEGHAQSSGSVKGRLVLTIDDSILAESDRDGTVGGIEFCDVGSTLASILHHAPVLKSHHVANALCRASVPQLGNLMTRIGANCPTSVPLLLLGCIQAYQQAVPEQSTSVANASKQGVLALAKLSQRERSRVMVKLQAERIMWDTQLELAIQVPLVDETAAARLLVEQLNPGRSAVPNRLGLSGRQSPGENSIVDYTMDREHLHPKQSETPFITLLTKRPLLYKKTLQYFVEQFRAMTQSRYPTNGRLILLLKGLSYLLIMHYPSQSSKLDVHSYLLDTILPVMKGLVEKILDDIRQQHSTPTSVDLIVKHVHCGLLLLLARILQETSEPGTNSLKKYEDIYRLLGECSAESLGAQGFRDGLEKVITRNSPSLLHTLVVDALTSRTIRLNSDSSFAVGFLSMENGWKQVCVQLQLSNDVNPTDNRGFDDLETELLGLLHEMRQRNITEIDDLKVAATLQKLLSREQWEAQDAIMGDLVSTFVSTATTHLVRRDLLTIPYISSTKLEEHTSHLFQPGHENVSDKARATYFLQLLHAFEFLEAKPGSPFAFDPRAIPLRWVLESLKGSQTSCLLNRLNKLAIVHCRDVCFRFERSNVVSPATESRGFTWEPRRRLTTGFYESLRCCVLAAGKDKDASRIESMFLQAKITLSECDLCCTVCSAFLTSAHRPRAVFSYCALLRDPLVLLKCPARIWLTRGLRRIALTVLSSLLESNALLVRELTPLQSSAEEFIASRDLLVIRCLLVYIAGTDKGIAPLTCPMTSSLIRSMIAAHDGTVVALVKQGLPERALDWLVECVPECMNDSQLLLQSLSDRSPLTAADRLVVSDAVLRIVIVHGLNSEDESAEIACAALAQLIGSFFLVIGPVDVPVNALMVDDSGLDVTQIARKAAFRMLEALIRVRGRRDELRRKCGIALQKLVGLCKNESSIAGVAGPVAGRRKAFLKELYDLVVKASANLVGVLAN